MNLVNSRKDSTWGVRYTAHKDIGKQVTVTTYDSLILGLKDGSLDPAVFDLVILDEAHRGLSEKRQEAIKSFDTSFVFGFSATPTFTESKSLDRLLGEPIYEVKVREAIESGLLCGVSVMIAKTEVDLSSVELDSSGQYQQRELEEALNTQALTQSAFDLYRKMFDEQQAIVFCVGVQHAKAVAKVFMEAGVSAAVVWGAMPDYERDRILKAYQQGEIKVLTNVDVLTEGFDAPEASVCFNLAPTGSLVRAEQRGGRVLRTDPKRKDKVATVVEFLHQDSRSRISPILFSEILNDAVVVPLRGKSHPLISDGKRSGPALFPNVSGLEVVTNVEEVLRITHEAIKDRQIEQRVKKLSWNEFVSEVRSEAIKFGIVGGKNWYRKVQKEHSNWPSHPEGTYVSDWKTWPELFGREVKKLSWHDFVYSVRETAKIQQVDGSFGWYMKERKKHKGWPPQPEYYYDLWKSWPDLFEREVIEKLPWDIFMLAVRSVAEKEGIIGTVGWYKELQKEHPDWPSNPNVSYKNNWSSWPELFGRKKKS